MADPGQSLSRSRQIILQRCTIVDAMNALDGLRSTLSIPTHVWRTYVLTLLVVLVAPGPSVLLVVSQRLKLGRRGAAWTVAGDLSANALQIAAVAIAATAITTAAADYRLLAKIGGVLFLLVTGIRQLAARCAPDPSVRRGRGRAFATGFVVSVTNPKAILFLALLLPTFVEPALPAAPQYTAFGVVFLALDALCLTAYLLVSNVVLRLARSPRDHAKLMRVSGGLRIAAAALVAYRV